MRALLVDLDGTIADSLPVLRSVFEDFVHRLGGSQLSHPFERFNGPTLEQIVATLKKELAPTRSASDLLKRYNFAIDQAYAGVAPCPGASEFLAKARTMGWRLIIVTSNARARAAMWLERTGLAPLVDGLISADQVRRGKPAPDPYLVALDLADVTASNALVIEDSPQGVQAAQSAGLSVIVYQPFGRADCDWPEGVTLCRDYAAITEAVVAIDKIVR